MANVDRMERIVKTLFEKKATLPEAVSQVEALPQGERTTPFRTAGLSPLEGGALIAQQLQALHQEVLRHVPPGETFTSSRDNKAVADLVGEASGTLFELKIGPGKTDGNLGLKAFHALTGGQFDLSALDLTERREWQRHAAHHGAEASRAFWWRQQEALAETCRQSLSREPKPYPFLDAFVGGATTLKAMGAVVSQTARSNALINVFPVASSALDAVGGYVWRSNRGVAHGERLWLWDVESTEDRLNFRARSDDGVTVRMVLNQKNSYKLKRADGTVERTTYSTHGLLGNPSFNAWVSGGTTLSVEALGD